MVSNVWQSREEEEIDDVISKTRPVWPVSDEGMGLPGWLVIDQYRFAAVHEELAKREHQRSRLRNKRQRADKAGHLETFYSASQGHANQDYNRYCDILPYDRTRVRLDSNAYINASLVQEPDLGLLTRRRWWIAAQAPKRDTLSTFWELAASKLTSEALTKQLPPVNLIVQLTSLVENGRPKCEPYFPDAVGSTWDLEGLSVTLESKEKLHDRRMSKVRLRAGQLEKTVTHVEFLGWRDHGVPSDSLAVVKFIEDVVALNDSIDPEAPILLHCSAGVGRTGSLITVASLLPLVGHKVDDPKPPQKHDSPLGPLAHADFVSLAIDALRDQRCTMVQTPQQEMWCYQALAAAWNRNQRQ